MVVSTVLRTELNESGKNSTKRQKAFFINLTEYPVGFAAGMNVSPERSGGKTYFSYPRSDSGAVGIPRGSAPG